MTPVSPEMSAAARLSTPPVSCRLSSPAALATWAPPRAAISAPIAESSGPPRATMSAPVWTIWRTSLIQCSTGQRLVAWAAPGAIATSARLVPTPARVEPRRRLLLGGRIEEELRRAAVGLDPQVGGRLEVALRYRHVLVIACCA